MNLFTPPPETKYTVLNLGAGVQSSCLALMAAKGVITPMPDFAVFADTQAEPTEVYNWLDWLETQLPFPVYRVTKGDLTADSLKPAYATKKAKLYSEGEKYMRRIIPIFGIKKNGQKTAAIGRSCTADYKIAPIEKVIKEKCAVKRAQKEITVTQWVGISWDELQRMKEARKPWTQLRWPLIERRMTREQCKQWLLENGFPEPPRSACYYCPFHSDTEWRRLRDTDPEHFAKAVQFDKDIRELSREDRAMEMEVYLHNSCKPLGEIDFDNDEDKGQKVWDFQAECEGMCGV
jgi:3'-phosphoadenosine 5'-phosphosulfate sulfotransferase (PAPS reductase)/FAD synthetase